MRLMQAWALKEFVGAIVVEPVFSVLKAGDDGMTAISMVLRRMLIRRRIAATNMSALGAAPEVQPPAFRRQTFDAAGTTRPGRRIDAVYLIWLHHA